MWTSYLIEQLPHDMVKTMARHGWHTLELSDEHGHDLLKLGAPEQVGAEFRRFAGDHGISFPQGHFYLANKGFRPEDREGRRVADIAPADDAEYAKAMEDMKRWVDLFNALGIEAGVLHVGGQTLASLGWDDERILARRAQAVREVAEHARGGVTQICLENLTHAMGYADANDAKRVLAAVDMPNVGVCLDTGHANISGVSCSEFIRELGPELKALHIADNLGKNDDHILPYGRGTVPWPEVMKALREVGYAGLFNFEVPGENRCPMPIREAKLDYSLQLAEWMIANG
jgi:sugar phosphate isomerase/epimerase